MLIRLCSNSFKLGFSSTWTEHFQMYKLDLEKAKEPEIKLPTSVGSYKKQGNSRKISTSASLTMIKPFCGSQQTGKFEMKIPDHLIHLLRNLYASQETTVRIGHGTTNWFKIGKGVCQDYILSPCLFNLYVECIIWNTRLDESQAWIKTAGRNINNLRYADDTILLAEREEELKSLNQSERGECKGWIKIQHSKHDDHGIWSHHFMANRWGKNGSRERLYFLGLHNHCGWWM